MYICGKTVLALRPCDVELVIWQGGIQQVSRILQDKVDNRQLTHPTTKRPTRPAGAPHSHTSRIAPA